MEFDEKVKNLKDFQAGLQHALNSIQDHLMKQEVPTFTAMCAMAAILDTYKRMNPEDAVAITAFQDNIKGVQELFRLDTTEVH